MYQIIRGREEDHRKGGGMLNNRFKREEYQELPD